MKVVISESRLTQVVFDYLGKKYGDMEVKTESFIGRDHKKHAWHIYFKDGIQVLAYNDWAESLSCSDDFYVSMRAFALKRPVLNRLVMNWFNDRFNKDAKTFTIPK